MNGRLIEMIMDCECILLSKKATNMILSKKLSYLVHESSNHINKSDHGWMNTLFDCSSQLLTLHIAKKVYLHVLCNDEYRPVLAADPVELDQVLVLQLRHHLYQRTILRQVGISCAEF